MATKALRPQDLLGERFRVRPAPFYRRRNFAACGNFSDAAVDGRRQQRKTSPKNDRRRFNSAAAPEENRSNIGGGGVNVPRRRTENGGASVRKVTLLRRGQSLSSIASKMSGENPKSTQIKKPIDDLGLLNRPKRIATNQIRMAAPPCDVYAGSAFFSSPSPRSVPLPSFFSKKDSNDCQTKPMNEDGATRDLRRLLRLE